MQSISNTLQDKVMGKKKINFSRNDLNDSKKQMLKHADNLEFEEATKIKDIIKIFNNACYNSYS
ncbi:hypothetical protein [Wolbachia pipientis]|uniref:hypothetical protein n=1 Tax=Wolbachia pipientis TaxID=955 RepID=UPI0025A3B8A2|nr:hypothetical protein [Wolbachia pipientis]MDM8335077.1 hypothetical protein [Wolbachia pipientis]